jgi:hypothetical protein
MISTNSNLNNLVALFLAEAIRSKRTSLYRAAEISERVLNILPKIKSETDALSMLTEIESDFQEVTALKQALHFGYKASDIKIYEDEIKIFASKIFEKDITMSNTFLQDATKPGTNIQELCLKYPNFCNFLLNFSSKAPMLKGLKVA